MPLPGNIYKDYVWSKGVPIGKEALPENDVRKAEKSYRILQDAYAKWISIERYERGVFQYCVYDSRLLDFRKVFDSEGKDLWYREVLSSDEKGHPERAAVFNENDQVLLIEQYQYEGEVQVAVHWLSSHGVLLAIQKIQHQKGDVQSSLFDAENHFVCASVN